MTVNTILSLSSGPGLAKLWPSEAFALRHQLSLKYLDAPGNTRPTETSPSTLRFWLLTTKS